MVKTAIAEGCNWRSALDEWLLAYRNTAHSITGKSPALMMFGRNLNDKLPAINPTTPKVVDHTSVRERDARKKEMSKRIYDKKHRASSHGLKAGDTVGIRNKKKSKTTLPWNPKRFKVTAVKGNSLVVEGNNQRLMRHVTAVKRLPAKQRQSDEGNPKQAKELPPRRISLRQFRRPPNYYELAGSI